MTGQGSSDLHGQHHRHRHTVACGGVRESSPRGLPHVETDSQFGAGPMGAFKCKIQEKITALDNAYNNVYNSTSATSG